MYEKHQRKGVGSFSRRHDTSEAHFVAQAVYRERHSPEIVAERQAERATRTPAEQIALLDQRLGIGLGAVRERAKLKKLGAK